MCGRYMSTTSPQKLAAHFAVDDLHLDDDLEPRWNVAPTLPVLAIAESPSTGRRKLGTFRWGLDGTGKLINARGETVRSRPSFRDAFAHRRCIIPADGFYEWKAKQPYAITHADGTPLAFAGLWAPWQDLRTCTIVTTSANERISELHDRMPVVLPRESWDAWLDPDNTDTVALTGLLVPAPSEDFAVRPVSRLVNNVKNEGPELLDPPAPESEPESEPHMLLPLFEQ